MLVLLGMVIDENIMDFLECDRENREHLKYVRNVYCLLTNHVWGFHVPKLQTEHCYKSRLIKIKLRSKFAENDVAR